MIAFEAFLLRFTRSGCFVAGDVTGKKAPAAKLFRDVWTGSSNHWIHSYQKPRRSEVSKIETNTKSILESVHTNKVQKLYLL
jgi:hypothetical protein